MSGNTISARIKLRRDTEANWSLNSPVLLKGELAVTELSNEIRFKIGDGTKTWSQLPYVGSKELETELLKADNLQVGYAVSAGNYSAAIGTYVSATGSGSAAFGVSSSASHNFSFVWNGDSSAYSTSNRYTSPGIGKFAINPVGGLSGFYIGTDNLASYLDGVESRVGSNIGYLSSEISGLQDVIDGLNNQTESISPLSVMAVGLSADTVEIPDLSSVYCQDSDQTLGEIIDEVKEEAGKNFLSDGMYFPVGAGKFRKVTIQYDDEQEAFGFVIASTTSSYDSSTGVFTDD